jgi:dTMP kinase
MSARGRFITVEGIDGAGKSSHLDFLCGLVRARGHEVEKTFEPGGTAFGKALREVILGHPTSARAEALAMFAAREAHVEGLILPALEAGRWVVCDRFTDSTYAYQCGGRQLPRATVDALAALVHPGLAPDATFLFDIDPATAQARQRAQGRALDEFEKRELDYHGRVRNAYLAIQRAEPGRVHLIDASAGIEQVRAQLAARFAEVFP